ncbi:FliG C-terminal domain-containing protein [Planctomycetota bacterium]
MESLESNKHKAALLLMSLDSQIATKLIKGLSPSEVEELSLEMAHIKAQGHMTAKNKSKVTTEFCRSLVGNKNEGLNLNSFFNETLGNVLGAEKAKKVQSQVRDIMENRNPFDPINAATNDELALALEKESPQTIAIILSELNPRKAAELLSLFDKDRCFDAVWGMTNPPKLNKEIRERIAGVICKRLKGLKGEVIVQNDDGILRDIAIMLSDVERDLRDETLGQLGGHDEETAATIKKLMVTWQDIPTIADRSLQEALRAIDSNKLALALYQADEEIAEKIRANISERARETLEEEMSLMQEPLDEEVLEAREEVVKPLRDANEEGTLRRTK